MSSIPFPRQSPIFSSQHSYFRETFSTIPKHSRFTTHLPTDKSSERMYKAASIILTPWKTSLQLLARTIEPLPGKDKNRKLWGLAVRISSLVGLLISLPFGLLSLIPGLPLYLHAHKSRPYISVIDNSANVHVNKPKLELDVRTYNVGFVHEFMRIVGDLRSVKERAREIANHILQEKESPDVICFQEGFHQDGTKVLCDKLKEKYPFIIHSVAPHGVGFPSGKIIASKYPIEEVSFRILPHMIGPERMAPRGILGVRIDLGDKRYANIYNAHLQSLLGKARVDARLLQMQQILKWIDEDHQIDLQRGDTRTKIGDFLMGDFNVSLVTAWGDENPGENYVDAFIKRHFYNPFYEEHDEKTGARIKGNARFLDPSTPNAKEATRSWYLGPFANRGVIFRIKEWFEAKFRGFIVGKKVVPMEDPILWAGPEWNSGPRTANAAEFDRQLVRRRESHMPDGIAEIEHVTTAAQSAPSDHLPLRAIYDLSRFKRGN